MADIAALRALAEKLPKGAGKTEKGRKLLETIERFPPTLPQLPKVFSGIVPRLNVGPANDVLAKTSLQLPKAGEGHRIDGMLIDYAGGIPRK